MKHSEIKMRLANVVELVNYCNLNKVKNIVLNIGLLTNFDILKDASDKIDKCISQELKDLEVKVAQIGKDLKAKFPEDAIFKAQGDFELGYKNMNTEDKTKHDALMIEYNKDMEEEMEIKLELIDMSKIEGAPIDTEHAMLLKYFIKK